MNKASRDLWLESMGSHGIRVVRANTFFKRLRGLLGRTSLPMNEGLLLEPCSAVHMMGMKFPIDIVFLSLNDRVLSVFTHVPPGWRGYTFPGTHRILELAAGAAESIPCIPGSYLRFQNLKETEKGDFLRVDS